MNANEEESNWDSLLTDLGLEASAKPAAAAPPPPPKPSEAAPAPVKFERREAAEAVPARMTEIDADASEGEGNDDAEPSDFGAGIVEDATDVLDDEAPESGEGAAEGEGKGRRRRRRRRRKKGAPGDAVVADGVAKASPVEPTEEGDELTFAEPDDDAPVEFDAAPIEDAAEDDDEVEEIVPEFAGVEEMEDDSTEPLPEWKVTAWTDLVATLYRPQDR